MTDAEFEIVLLNALRQAFEASRQSCSAHGDRPAGVLILWYGHLRGIWFRRDSVFQFVPGGYSTPAFSCATVAEAVTYTLDVVCTVR